MKKKIGRPATTRATIACSLAALLAGCSTTPGMMEQVPMDKEVMGIGDNIKVWRDYRGVFYYVDGAGKPTPEPVKLSREQCQTRPGYRGAYGLTALYRKMTGWEEKAAAIEMQCEERQKWEQGSRYGLRYR